MNLVSGFKSVALSAFAAILLVGVFVITSPKACSALIAELDQESFGPTTVSPAFSSRIGASNTADRAQTFTVGKSGILSKIAVYVGRNTQATLPLLLDLRQQESDGSPSEADSGADVLAAVAIPSAEVGLIRDWLEIDLSSFNLNVTTGQALALALRSDAFIDAATPEYSWVGSRLGTYSNGIAYSRTSNTGSWTAIAFSNPNDTPDFYFRTYVTLIPEPSTSVILTLFICNAWWSRRSRIAN